jgi:hypothetical protein
MAQFSKQSLAAILAVGSAIVQSLNAPQQQKQKQQQKPCDRSPCRIIEEVEEDQ